MNKHLTQWDVIQAGARPVTKGCPCCGFDPLPPTRLMGMYRMACEADDATHTFEASGRTAAEAVANWNRRFA